MVAVGRGEALHRQAGFVVLMVRVLGIDAAIVADEALQVLEPLGDQGSSALRPVAQDAGGDDRRHGRSGLR